ncbi:CRISPR-associated endonuclease Cas1 [Umezakia ovalisporum]|uniref:CRISPR-associated endonuclease Cas1 n=1 Tax=Umezakia ovalisporum TaxID=75695 RepID=UPI0024771723|nr:CRISPR-associated endonuclease Cas1 [Umezakia ovalisporum]MDH6090158.1 CRISPR-associated endonuclease Cas1 [Umezakia ovalisporum Ak1311]
MSILYVTQPDAVLSKAAEAFKVALKQEDGGWEKKSVPAQTVEQVVLMGNPQITGDALVYALELGMPVHYLSGFGKYLGSALPDYFLLITPYSSMKPPRGIETNISRDVLQYVPTQLSNQ